MQRFFDIVLSGFALLVFMPFLLPIVLVLRFTGEGEVFFPQNRIGLNGNVFKLLKFATMLKDSPSLGSGTVTLKNDPRILPLGHFLRKTKINELPQLLNILMGDMSIVGPRPQTKRCFDAFPADVQVEIIKVRPGLSGIGSIIFRDEENLLHDAIDQVNFYDDVIAPYKGAVEKWYVSNVGIRNYLAVILVTVWVVIFPKSDIVWSIFKGLPLPPSELSEL